MRPVGRWGNRSTVIAVAASAATVTALTVGGIALADNGSGSGSGSDNGSTPTAQATPEPGAKADSKARAERRGRFGHRAGMPGMGLAAAPLHGEFVVRGKADGEYQTIAVQRGSVQSVSASALTLKSADGFVKTYAVVEESLVNAQRDGIGSVEKGDSVGVVATVDGDSATAVRVVDLSQRKATWEKLRPERRAERGAPGAPGPLEEGPGGDSDGGR